LDMFSLSAIFKIFYLYQYFIGACSKKYCKFLVFFIL
jgi:hypothetical protein